MKAASKNWSASLRSQRPMANGPATDEVQSLQRGKGSGLFPGERDVERPPGATHPRSAAVHADATGSKAGG